MKTLNQESKIFELLTTDKNSPLVKFKNAVPSDNLSYLNHWFEYLNYSINKKNIVDDVLSSYGVDMLDYEINFLLQNKIIEYIQDAHNEIVSQIKFEPRLEQYLNLFTKEERPHIQIIILANLYKHIYKIDRYLNLLDIGREFKIDLKFILSLNDSHSLFQDKVIELEESDFSGDKPWHLRDIYFNPAVFNIFADIKINQEEIAILADSKLLQLFGLVDFEERNSIELQLTEEKKDDAYDLNVDFEEGNFEQLFSNEFELLNEESSESDELDDSVGIDEMDYYIDNLDYLYHEYLYYKPLLALRKAEMESFSFDDKDSDRKARVLMQKAQKRRYLCDIKLENSQKNGFVPRLVKLAKKINLNDFEINVIKVVVTKKVFIDADSNYPSSNTVTVKDLIFLLIDDQKLQIRAKKYFQKNARLVASGLIHIEQGDSLNRSIYDSEIVIDSRLLDHLTGEEFNITDHVDGSFFYKSTIKIKNVIIPIELKERVLATINNFPTFLKTKRSLGYTEIAEYGNALVMLFVGKSGTGKTMLANAVSNHLNKKVLLFNLNNLSQIGSLSNEKQIFSVLFREARMNDAVLFFDESEVILQDRFNDLLIEIEKHEGIVIFATNATFLIDEAMRRRINLIINLPAPGPMLRKDIWEMHLPKKVTLSNDVNLDQIARRFELNGGLIKNAVFSALAQAVNNAHGEGEGVVLRMDHIEYGAKEQLHNKLFMSNLEKLKIPSFGLERIILCEKTENLIREFINIEKSKYFIESEWGLESSLFSSKGISILLHGPSGTGKTATAEAIAYEMGRKLKIVNYSQVISKYVGESIKSMEILFEQIADGESALLFDEADALFTKRTGVNGSTDRYANVDTDVLLSLIEQYDVMVILTTNFLSNIDKAFFRRMDYIIEIAMPGVEERFELWNMYIPEKLPVSCDLNIKQLAENFEFSGDDIKNCVKRVATRKAKLLDKSVKFSQEDFVEVCEEILDSKNHNSNKIGFKKKYAK